MPMEKIIKVVLEKLMLLEEIMIISTGKDILWWPRETLTDEAAKELPSEWRMPFLPTPRNSAKEKEFLPNGREMLSKPIMKEVLTDIPQGSHWSS